MPPHYNPLSNTMARHLKNTNLRLHTSNHFEGLPTLEHKGPYISEYLTALRNTITRSLACHTRVYAFRVDLRLPADKSELRDEAFTNAVIQRFIESFKAKIKHNRAIARLTNTATHGSQVRYVWARELGQHGMPHYHMAIFLNHDAYNSLGKFEVGRENNYNRLVEAWASALRLPVERVTGLVHIPDNASYRIDRFDRQSQEAFFRRVSYICKAATKAYGDGQHGFGYSRI